MKVVPPQGNTPAPTADDMLIRMWLHGRGVNTVAAYTRDARAFLAHAGRPLAQVTLAELQAWDASMPDAAPATRARRLAAVKSLLAFASREGLIGRDPGAALRVAKPTETAVERILAEGDVVRAIAAEPDPRARAVVRTIYVCGLRASEAAGLRWRDMTGSDRRGGQARILGKGAKLRTVEVPASLWRELAALWPAGARPESPVLPGRGGAPRDRHGVWRVVKHVLARCGLDPRASTHWLRHSHVSHALDNGCAVHVVQKAVGHASLATTTRYAHARPGAGSAAFVKG